jgi:hypothetical protein
MDDMYDTIKRSHISTGHGGRDKMSKELSTRYANVTREAVELFKTLCVECLKKRKRMAVKGVVVRPILTSEFGSRGQVDLIDMQSMSSCSYKWIMVYQDHLTKFCVLRPIASKRAAEVAFQLLDIFLLLGSPHILQSDNGCECTASVITELKIMWPELLMVHGKPRHPQSQGSVERLNCDVKDMLIAWLGDNNSTNWPTGLKFVQFSKNSSYHTGIKQTPYKALFGSEPRVGLRSTSLPTEVLERMTTESDLFAALQESTTEGLISSAASSQPIDYSQSSTSTSAYSDQSQVAASQPISHGQPSSAAEFSAQSQVATSQPIDRGQPSTAAAFSDQSQAASSQPVDETQMSLDAEAADQSQAAGSYQLREQLTSDQATSSHTSDVLEQRRIRINHQRKRARESMQQQAERMVKRSRIEHTPGDVGDNVTIPIPLVDRGRGDPRNILGVIVDRDENDLYRISVRAGVLHGKYSRNQFDLCAQKLLTVSDVCQDNEVSLRVAVQSESKCGGQGFAKCNCGAGVHRCSSNRCKCFRLKLKCNSRCHGSLSCDNKLC